MAPFDSVGRPLRFASIIGAFISIIIFPIWISVGRSRGSIIAALPFTIISGCLGHYIVLFGIAAHGSNRNEERDPVFVGILHGANTSTSPEERRGWARVLKPLNPWIVGLADTVLFWGFLIPLILLCSSFQHCGWYNPPMVLGAYCIMMLTIMAGIHLALTLLFLLTNTRRIFDYLRQERHRRAPQVCPRCGDHIAGAGQPTAEHRGRGHEGFGFYAALAADDDASADARLLGSPRAGGVEGGPVVPVEEYKDEVVPESDAVPAGQQPGIIVPAPASGLYDYGA